MAMTRVRPLLASIVALAACGAICASVSGPRGTATADAQDTAAEPRVEVDRSPVDVVLSADEKWAVTANETSATVSLVDLENAGVVREVRCSQHPAAVAARGETLLVTCSYSGTLERFRWHGETLEPMAKIHVGFEPVGVAISPDGREAYVALSMAAQVAVVDLETNQVAAKIDVGRWPRYLALTPDGARLAVNCNGDRAIAVVDTRKRAMLFLNDFGGINAGQMQVSADGCWVYVPWMIYRHNPIEERNVQRGWVLGSRIARLRMDEQVLREAITLDPPGKAVSDPHGLALSSDGAWMYSTGSGTHELLAFRLAGLPFQSTGGPGDHIDRELARDPQRFYRITLGGRPMGMRLTQDGRRALVTNYLLNSLQVVDLERREVAREISLGEPVKPSLARRGAAIFYDAGRSLDQWYACHTCHYEGGSSAVTMDTKNDGSYGTFKTVPNLYNVAQTAPWTWHGWQENLGAAVHKSITETMLGPEPTPTDIEAVLDFLQEMRAPPNPYRMPDGSLSEAARRGERIFRGETAGCSACHQGREFTDNQLHDVGLGSPKDVYPTYNTPSLRNVYRKVRLLHHGRAQSIAEVLTDLHAPQNVTGRGELSAEELADLIEYVKSL
jgi:YVTN family beta-propeller protein